MMDKLTLSFENNPGLAEAFGDKAVGDKVKLEIVGTVAMVDEAGAEVSVDKAVPEGYEAVEEAPPPGQGPPGVGTPPVEPS